MKKTLKYLMWGVSAIVVLALVAYLWAYQVATTRYDKQWTVHTVTFPIPFPLKDDELARLRADRTAAGAASTSVPLAGVNLQAVTLERAVQRGSAPH
jgi:Mlc titration factor MtfA (ptsG expression regulator)